MCQAAFLKLAALGPDARVEDARGYLYSIACNLVIDHLRGQIRREEVQRDLIETEEYRSATPSPEQAHYEKQRFAIFERALSTMPATRRRIFLLVRVECLSPREVAGQFGMSEGRRV